MRTDVRAQKMEIAWWGGQFYTKVCSSFVHLKEAKEAQEGLDAHFGGKNRPHEKKLWLRTTFAHQDGTCTANIFTIW